MTLHHKTHYYQPSPSSWEHEYVRWMKAKEAIKDFYKDYPHHIDRK